MANCIHGITNCTFLCNDFDAMVRFYRDTLEMPHVLRFAMRTESRKKPA